MLPLPVRPHEVQLFQSCQLDSKALGGGHQTLYLLCV